MIKVEGPIDRPLLGYLEERLDEAVADEAVVVLQLDSPGTLNEDAVALADRVASLPVPVIVWVGTVPARASGAGLLLLYASSLAATAPGAQVDPRAESTWSMSTTSPMDWTRTSTAGSRRGVATWTGPSKTAR